MDKVQRSGLMTLLVLLMVAAVGLVVGPRNTQDAKSDPESAGLDTKNLITVDLLPPSQRRLYVGPDNFRDKPVRDPLRGGSGRDVNRPPRRDPNRNSNSNSGSRSQQVPAGMVRVQPGERLMGIAQRELKDANRWREIADLNGITDPSKLAAGTLLKLPSGTSSGQLAGGSESASNNSSNRSNSSEEAALPETYVVRPNETPGEISKRFYNTTKHWRKLLEFNGMRDPKQLRAGQKLKIPPLSQL